MMRCVREELKFVRLGLHFICLNCKLACRGAGAQGFGSWKPRLQVRRADWKLFTFFSGPSSSSSSSCAPLVFCFSLKNVMRRPQKAAKSLRISRSMHICGLCFLCYRLNSSCGREEQHKSLVNAFVGCDRRGSEGFQGAGLLQWQTLGLEAAAKWPRTKAKSPTCTHNNDPDLWPRQFSEPARENREYICGYTYITLPDCISFASAHLHLWESITKLASASDFV